jgi:aminoglycoside phosphotransferase (APT) family kinase protein
VQKRIPAVADVEAFLEAHHGAPVEGVEVLAGGFWSAGFAYRHEGRDLVVRFGASRDGYDLDRAAMGFDRPGLPVPAVLAVGEGLGGAFAISVRHHGRFLEDIDPGEARGVGPAFDRVLAALRENAGAPDDPAEWHDPGDDPALSTWARWLDDLMADDPAWPTHGWRARLAEHPYEDRLFRACEARLHDLREACPERRDLVHGDLLHQNVLVDQDGSEVTAVFSWKCSVRGDFLWDVAWCGMWAPWHPGIEALGVYERAVAAPDLRPEDLVDAAARYACYQLQIGAHHLGWNAWIGNDTILRDVAARTEAVLEATTSA